MINCNKQEIVDRLSWTAEDLKLMHNRALPSFCYMHTGRTHFFTLHALSKGTFYPKYAQMKAVWGLKSCSNTLNLLQDKLTKPPTVNTLPFLPSKLQSLSHLMIHVLFHLIYGSFLLFVWSVFIHLACLSSIFLSLRTCKIAEITHNKLWLIVYLYICWNISLDRT